MTPIRFPEIIVVIAEDQPQYQALPAHIDEEGKITFCWQLTWRERIALLLTGRIWHQVLTFGRFNLQPQLLHVVKPELSRHVWNPSRGMRGKKV